MTRESLYFRLLLSVNSYQLTHGNLELIYGPGNNAMTFISISGPSVGTLELPPAVLETCMDLEIPR